VWLFVDIIVISMAVDCISSWGGGEILVGILHRNVGLGYLAELMPRVPSFTAINSWMDLDSVAVQMKLWWHQGGSLSAVEVVMVTMTFQRKPTGVACIRSTGK